MEQAAEKAEDAVEEAKETVEEKAEAVAEEFKDYADVELPKEESSCMQNARLRNEAGDLHASNI